MRSLRIVDRREDLAHLCNELRLTKALEVGTHQGVFADTFMARFAGELTCVDPWEEYTPDEHEELLPVFVPNVHDRRLDHDIATMVLTRKYPGRVTCVKGTLASLYEACHGEPTYDFIYIDGKHLQSDVARDVKIACELLKPGGLLAGHDYAPTNPELCGVAVAVNAFITQKNWDLYLTRLDVIPSWYARRSAHE